ncbi:MAG: GAF domain-containing protein [Anaerolineae bacterium]
MKVLLQPLFEELTPDDEEETLILVDQDGEYVVHPDESLLYGTLLGTGHNFFEDRPVDSRAMSASSTEAGALIQTEEIPDAFQYYANIDLGSNDSYDYHLLMIISKPASVVFEHVNNATITEIAFGLFTLFLSVVATSFLGRSMTAPLIKLANAATAIGQGDVNTEIPEVKSGDEVGQLATAFSKMAQDLKVSYGALEERVAARTADLQTSAEIAAAANQVRDVSDLMSLAVNLIRDRFNFYYVQVYISQGDQAVLREGTGYVGRRLLSRGHHLPLDGRSLVAEAIRSGKPQIVQDTKSNPNFLPNELLPDTRAEITIPLRTKNAVVGVLDIQHSVANVFDENSQRLFQSMADQLAVTFENVKLYETTQRRALEMETVAEVSAAISTSLNLDELLTQVANLTKTRFNRYHTHVYLLDNAGENLVLAAGAGEPGRIMKERGHSIPLNYEQSVVARAARSAEAVIVDDVTATPNFLANPLLPDTRSEMAIPIILGEQVLGVLDIQDNRTSAFNEEDVRIKSALADQIAVAVQNARAFQQVQNAERQVRQSVRSLEDLRFALDEAAIVAVTDVSGKITYVNDKFCEISKYSREELIGQDHRIINSSYHPKEFIRNVWVTIANGNVWQGEFCNRNKFGGIYWVDTTIVPLLNEQGKPAQYIAIRYEITARKEAELQVERRAAEMETVAQVSAATARILDVPDLLYQVSELTKERFGLYHAHIYLLNEEGDQLVLAGGAGEAGRIMVNQGRSIAIDSAQSIVANAARTHQAVIVNNVTDEETFLPNPLLPETKSELAAPMLVGDKLVGVLDVQSNVVNRFTEQDMQINVALADQIAVAVQNARAFEQMQIADAQLRRRAVEMQMVAEVSAAASRNLDGRPAYAGV